MLPPQVTEQVIEQVTEQVGSLLRLIAGGKSYSTSQIMVVLDLKHRPSVLYNYLQPSLKQGFVEMTIPETPNSPKQRYRLTDKGRLLQTRLLKERFQSP